MKIENLMSRPAACCSVHDHLDAAAAMMWDRDCGALPVVDDDGVVCGMITDRDICMAAFTQGTALAAIPVEIAMARQVFTASPEDDVERAENLMSEKQIRRVPVVDRGRRPIGMLSLNDLARSTHVAEHRRDGAGKVVHTLAAVCRPRARPPASPA